MFPDDLQGIASKAFGAVAILGLLIAVWRMAPKSKGLAALLLWWAWEECQVAGCSFAYMANPWPVPSGMGICSARVGFDFGAIGLFFVAILAFYLSTLTVSTPEGNC
jgi:hypothetical protein